MSRKKQEHQDLCLEGRKVIGKLQFCNCGTPDDAYTALRDMLTAYNSPDSWEASWVRREAWKAKIGKEANHLLLYFVTEANLMEHGGSVGGSWLTKEGKAALAFFVEWGVDTEQWPDVEDF